jgi:hypothetical protein
MVVATSEYERPAKLWVDRRRVAFDFCDPVQVLTVFRLPSGRVGLTVWCAEPVDVRLVALDLATGNVEQLTAAPGIDDGAWFEPTGTGLVAYSSGNCQGVGEIDREGVVRPLALTVDTVSLATAFPPPGYSRHSSCVARAVARRPAAAANGRYVAFFLHVCAGTCTGDREFDEDWLVVVHDRGSGRVTVSPRRFRQPHGLAVSDDGAVAISARYNNTVGIWYCPAANCAEPRRLVGGAFQSPNFGPDGAKIVAVEIGATHPKVVDV